MVKLVPAHLAKKDLHGRTAMLAHEAGEAGDEFLKYLYLMALRRIEETATASETPIDRAEARRLKLASSS